MVASYSDKWWQPFVHLTRACYQCACTKCACTNSAVSVILYCVGEVVCIAWQCSCYDKYEWQPDSEASSESWVRIIPSRLPHEVSEMLYWVGGQIEKHRVYHPDLPLEVLVLCYWAELSVNCMCLWCSNQH